ncbi:DUF5694 domain-containing protein [Kordia zhangzhouensis]|uniref:DUF5694 domain-containing protein n=1 Tax=Kordia zhangzhouensis TaxID=1620405 RepID=UPI0006293D13|nr:DUF5694 domain-containing protein [Kordia zhangzhouensis]
MKKTIIALIIITFFGCTKNESKEIEYKQQQAVQQQDTNKVKVLNFGTMHLSGSGDAYASTTNSNDSVVKHKLQKVIDKLVAFKPTVICIEIPWESNDHIAATYKKYIKDQTHRLNWSEEVNVLGLEVGRLSNTKRIYGIDNPSGLEWGRLVEMANTKKEDSIFLKNILDGYEGFYKLDILEQFKKMNSTEYKRETFDLYNFLATTYETEEKRYEGSEIVAGFYKRNLQMYTNFRAIPLSKDDRVLIILGTTHTAYLDEFIGNSSLYHLENAEEYTNF